MIRTILGAVLVMLALPATASGASIGLRDDLAATQVALAGPDVLIARAPNDGHAELRAVPRAGGAGRTLLSVSKPRSGWPAEVSLAASDERVAVIFVLRGPRGGIVEWRVYSGPPSGPLQLVRRTANRGERTWFPFIVDVDGDRALLVEVRSRGERVRAELLGPDGLAPVPWVRDAFAPVAIAGGHAAVIADQPTRLAVADLVSGAEQGAVDADPSDLEMLDLGADGRLLAETAAGLLTIGPGEQARTLPGSKGLIWPRFAGASIAALDDGRPVLVGVDGSRQALGEPSEVLDSLVADDRGVAWIANGCVRYAAFAVTATAPQADDPCPATEIGLDGIADSRLRGRRVRAAVRCVTAPGGTCRGTLLARRAGRIVARGRFAVPVGTERRVPIRLTRAEAAHARRHHGSSVILSARISDGRVGAARGAAELGINVR